MDLSIDESFYGRVGPGYGDRIDLAQPFVLVLQHPVTTEYEKSRENMQALLGAVNEINMPTLLFWPNIDGGTDGASAAVREFLKLHTLPQLSVYKNFNSDDFYRSLNAASVAVGNSSSFIRECSYLGTPAVLVGTRQRERERGPNVVDVGYDADEIASAIRAQLAHGKYERSTIYGDGKAAERIAHTLATITLPSTQKTFHNFDTTL
jgi:UDP-N-acetylglucosamine 2-epimerase